ncbi:MAG: GNAT family N-acetyltransferase [Anaerolineae bacterium]|nr:GNAT family N-acetyltransferase [Anaerolineae bacterium]
MDDILLLPAHRISAAERAAVINAAYADYNVPFHVTPRQMQDMVRFYDVDLVRSWVARGGNETVGVALLAHRGSRGWISAVGVAPPWRRRGIARRLMEALIASAQAIGLRLLTLEVISANEAARQLYRSLGFLETRELLCWKFPAEADPLPIPREGLQKASPDVLWRYFQAWHDQQPCWQREEATLRRMAGQATGYLLTMEDTPAGYCLVADRGEAVALLDVGINPQFGPVIAGRVLLQALSARYPGRPLTITNVPADSGLNRALAALHFLVVVRQQEMARTLT